MDPRFVQDKGIGIFTGNELIVKGGLESRMGLLTGYPGSPVAEVFDAAERIQSLLNDRGILVQIANNEALSAARLNGAQMGSVRAMAVMKSVGAHVASDGLALGNLAGTGDGAAAVVVFGDDTWSEGTQVPADSRFMAKHLYMPVMEPSTFQELKDWIGLAFELSEQTRLYFAYLITSNQADGGGTVQVRPNQYPTLTFKNPVTIETSAISTDDRVIIPPHTTVKEVEVLEQRFPRLLELVREHGINQILYPPDSGKKPIGFVTSGLAFCYLEHALTLANLDGKIPILKFGVTHPVDPDILKTFAGMVDEIYVVEEKRAFLEEQVAAALQMLHQSGELDAFRVWGKRFPDGQPGFPESKGMDPSIVFQVLVPILKTLDDSTIPVDRGLVDRTVALMEETKTYDLAASARTPSFCPGCPHRDSASVLDKMIDDFQDASYMQHHHGRDPVDLVFHGDIGCYSLLKYKPFNRLMHNLSGMGLGGGTGAGIDPFIRNKQLVFMGDSTFFHSGMAAISDSIKHGQDIAYIILDNKTTAMTGHQPTPGVDVDIMGNPTFAQDIEQVVRGMAGGEGRRPIIIGRVNPADREAYQETLEKALLQDGVKIIIADKECGITYHRRKRSEQSQMIREKGFLPEEQLINITPEVCEYCLECTKATGCSGLVVEETLRGPKITTDLSLCVADGACTKVEIGQGDKTCPSFEQVKITRTQRSEVQLESIDLSDLPEPEVKGFDSAWYAYVAGVGGMGVNTVSAILAVAGARQGYTVRFTNKKGLAIRNGSVYSHVSFAKDDRVISQLIPYGHADLLLGLDILEAVRGLDPDGHGRVASPRHTTAIVETGKHETILSMTGEDNFEPKVLGATLKQYTNPDTYFGMDLAEISERFLGNKIYANSILLGAAYQRGTLPLSLENIRWAIEHNIRKPRELEANLKAFDMGRKAALDPDVFFKAASSATYEGLVAEKAGILERTRGSRVAADFRNLAETAMRLSEADRVQYALGVYDLIQWGCVEDARVYVNGVQRIYKRDSSDLGYEATGAVIQNLARVMAYKDEIYVAHLLTSEEKRLRDYERYRIDPKRGDRISYVHLTRPHFSIFGIDVKFDIQTRDWMLRWMRRMKFLRTFLPHWHKEEKDYRDWYQNLVERFDFEDADRYRNYVQVFRLPEEVRGYREVIWSKMQAAYRMAEFCLNGRGEASDGHLKIEPAQEVVIGK